MIPPRWPDRMRLGVVLLLASLMVGGCDDGPPTAPVPPRTPDATEDDHPTDVLQGPAIVLTTNVGERWRSGEPVHTGELFVAQGIRFRCTATAGPSGSPVLAVEWSRSESGPWEPFPPEGLLWYPTSGLHAVFVRAIDKAGATTILEARLQAYAGPRFCDVAGRHLLVVLDTDPFSLIVNGILPPDYTTRERQLLDTWLEGYDYEVIETHGTVPPSLQVLDCASSTIWLHSTAVEEGDASVLERLHTTLPDFLPSYVASGGNLLLCGIQPTEAMRWFRPADGSEPLLQQYPVDFQSTVVDSLFEPHWAATHLGIARVEASVGNTEAPEHAALRLSVATSAVSYPDLPFDPSTWPDGANQGGFGYYDRGLTAATGAEVIYTIDGTGLAVGVRRLTSPGVNGNCVFLGLHPYFVERPAFRDLVQAVLTQFGEIRNP